MGLEKENEILQSLIPGVKLTFDKSHEFVIQGIPKVNVTLKPAVKGALSQIYTKFHLDKRLENEARFRLQNRTQRKLHKILERQKLIGFIFWLFTVRW